jgi:hypothetical protein
VIVIVIVTESGIEIETRGAPEMTIRCAAEADPVAVVADGIETAAEIGIGGREVALEVHMIVEMLIRGEIEAGPGIEIVPEGEIGAEIGAGTGAETGVGTGAGTGVGRRRETIGAQEIEAEARSLRGILDGIRSMSQP